MIVFDKLNEIFNVIVGALDGAYGWVNEALALLAFVAVFNFLAKYGLGKLQKQFEKQKKIWSSSFVKSLYLPLSYYVWFFAIVHAIDIINQRVFASPPFTFSHMALSVGLILTAGWFLMRWKRMVVNALITKSKNHEVTFEQGKVDVIDKVLTMIILFSSLLLVMEVTNRSVNTLIAFGGVGGLAIAFASQEIIANFFGGLMIYLTHPFAIGDWINLPEHNIEGYVEEIGWYMTLIRSLEKRPIYIPNSMFSKVIVMTPSRMSHRQFKETIGLRYSDMPVVKELLKDLKKMLSENPHIDHTLNQLVHLTSFSSYTIDIIISAYFLTINAYEYAEARQDLLFKIYDIITKHGAEMPFPTSQMISIPNHTSTPNPSQS